MYILINPKTMCVLHRSDNRAVLAHLAHLEITSATCLFEETNLPYYRQFSVSQLRTLYEEVSQAKCAKYVHHSIAEDLAILLTTIEPTVVNAFELGLQAAQIKMSDKNCYLYSPGKRNPTLIAEAEEEKPRRGCLQRVKLLPPAKHDSAAPSPVIAPAWHIDTSAPAPKYAPPWAKK